MLHLYASFVGACHHDWNPMLSDALWVATTVTLVCLKANSLQRSSLTVHIPSWGKFKPFNYLSRLRRTFCFTALDSISTTSPHSKSISLLTSPAYNISIHGSQLTIHKSILNHCSPGLSGFKHLNPIFPSIYYPDQGHLVNRSPLVRSTFFTTSRRNEHPIRIIFLLVFVNLSSRLGVSSQKSGYLS